VYQVYDIRRERLVGTSFSTLRLAQLWVRRFLRETALGRLVYPAGEFAQITRDGKVMLRGVGDKAGHVHWRQ
jgi:hypothetical protein